MKEELSNSDIEFVVFGHAGQGHMHANLLPSRKEELFIAEEVSESIAQRAVKLHGTVSAEHGTGKLKSNLLGLMYSNSELDAMQKLVNHISQI